MRTYLLKLSTAPDFSAARAADSRTARKVAAASAMQRASDTTLSAVGPQLDALQGAGLVHRWEALPYIGYAIAEVDEGDAARGYEALRSIEGIGRITRSRTRQIAPPVAATSAEVPRPTSDGVEWNVAKVRAPELWARGIDGSGITVGITDGGVDVQHEALRAHYRGTQADGSQMHDYNWFDALDGSLTPLDPGGHGSHVTGTAVGGTDARKIGVAPGARFIASRLYDKSRFTDVSFARGVNWMLAPTDVYGNNPDPSRAPDVVSSSWGWTKGYGLGTIRDIVRPLAESGIFALWAAGNNGPTPGSLGNPADAPEIFAVGATTAKDGNASFSARGPGKTPRPDGTIPIKPDVVAPGEGVTSAKANSGTDYRPASGTSMAAPAVAGVAALLLSAHPEATPDQIRAALRAGAVDLGNPGPDTLFGAGRVDAVTALAALKALLTPGGSRI